MAIGYLPSAAEAAPTFGRGAISGHPWHSGCGSAGITAFESYRGRKCDTYTLWCKHETWSDITSLIGNLSNLTKLPGRISYGLAPLPKSHSILKNSGNYKLAAKGSFDGYYTQFAQKLAASGQKNLIIRIGWEINDKSRPWYGGIDPEAYKDSHRRIVGILRRYLTAVAIEWSCLKKGHQNGPATVLYPGREYVDIVGVNYYDGYPALTTQSAWNSQYNAEYKGGPWGIGSWFDFTRSEGKKLSCSEWGINAGRYGCVDNPLYIENMWNCFLRNASTIAYENYFNQISYHQLTPSSRNPRASAKYKQLWG